MSNVREAQTIHRNLKLHQDFWPTNKFGEISRFGKIYKTSGNKLMKISNWTRNSEREMRIAKIAGNARVGPKVYNTRTYTLGTKKMAVITMNKIPGAKSLYNAIDNGNVTNFKNVENIVGTMHRAGIHHGNLHGGNILVYKNFYGKLRMVPIDFGAAKFHPKIQNTRSAVQYAIEKRGWRGGSTPFKSGNFTAYKRPGRNQPVRSNENMMRHLKEYFNFKKG